MLEITLTWVSGYRRSQKERQRTIYSLDHARSGPNLHSVSASPLSFRSRHHPAVLDYCLDRNDFHGVSRAEGPSQLTWKSAMLRLALSRHARSHGGRDWTTLRILPLDPERDLVSLSSSWLRGVSSQLRVELRRFPSCAVPNVQPRPAFLV